MPQNEKNADGHHKSSFSHIILYVPAFPVMNLNLHFFHSCHLQITGSVLLKS